MQGPAERQGQKKVVRSCMDINIVSDEYTLPTSFSLPEVKSEASDHEETVSNLQARPPMLPSEGQDKETVSHTCKLTSIISKIVHEVEKESDALEQEIKFPTLSTDKPTHEHGLLSTSSVPCVELREKMHTHQAWKIIQPDSLVYLARKVVGISGVSTVSPVSFSISSDISGFGVEPSIDNVDGEQKNGSTSSLGRWSHPNHSPFFIY